MRPRNGRPGQGSANAMRKTSITIAIFIDSLGWRLANENGFLRHELPFRGPLATTFGTSSSCIPTILTGVAPREHGHFAPFAYDPEGSPFRKLGWMRYVPKFLADMGCIRQWMGRWVQRQVGLNRNFQLHNTPLQLLPQMNYTDRHALHEPGGKKRGRLGKCVRDDVKKRGKLSERSAEAEGQRNDAGVFDRGVGQQAF